MFTLDTTIDINASPERIWAILTNFSHYSEWNPFIINASGVPKAGQRLSISIATRPGRSMTFRPQVLRVKHAQVLAWRGRFLIPGLFDGVHTFVISPLEDGTVRLSHSETFSGLLVPFMRRKLNRDTRAGFSKMNHALRVRAEAASQPRG
ncbi:SRPBCC domain-containing protein [Alcanivorax sp. JB21]|uniref:SRPBCC family protein n=1 Tax=Alcanivorax limicola TaxID=2874102 RepID=UPI001CBB3964|nr:SRPBCC domain-containing protein [Alcanivorax limicola]MBZ2190012.1 SRPBCC domain-containing protein [Alcanivorax limicola]